mgnify:CR=1 FL=1
METQHSMQNRLESVGRPRFMQNSKHSRSSEFPVRPGYHSRTLPAFHQPLGRASAMPASCVDPPHPLYKDNCSSCLANELGNSCARCVVKKFECRCACGASPVHMKTIPTIGILGASISFGIGAPAGFGYADILGTLGVRVHNQAVPGTGSAMPSFCLNQMLPPSLELDVLVIEFAINDFHYPHHAELGLDGRSFDPMESMERLLRTVSISRPATVPLVLYICGHAREHCEGKYTEVAKRYGAPELIFRTAFGNDAPVPGDSSYDRIGWDALGVHPDTGGHRDVAVAVRQAVTRLAQLPHGTCRLPGCSPSHLPAPRWLKSRLERVDTPWACQNCDESGCERLQPVAVSGFRVEGGTAGTGHRSSLKYGWVGRRAGSEVSFRVAGGHRALISMLCSYANVGSALVTLKPSKANKQWGDLSGSFSSHSASVRHVNLTWSARSSQQCIIDAGHHAWAMHGSYSLTVRVVSEDQIVKVMGLMTQPV